MASVRSNLAELPDPQNGKARRHNLLDILTTALIASICGAQSCLDFADFAGDQKMLFRDFLELLGNLTSHDTFSRLFRLFDPTAFATCLATFAVGLGTKATGVIAMDGKTLRRSFDRAAARSPLHVVSAFAADVRMTISQLATASKESEIIASRRLLGLIDLNGALVTGDALHCRGETARLIKQRGGDWLFTLKANRPVRHVEVRAWFADPANCPHSEQTTTDADNGRLEVRRYMVSHNVSWMLSDRRHPDEAPMPGLAMLGMVKATVTRDRKTGLYSR